MHLRRSAKNESKLWRYSNVWCYVVLYALVTYLFTYLLSQTVMSLILVDTQAPRVDKCRSPPTFTRRTADDNELTMLSWEEPLFSDNSHGPVTVTQSHGPPAAFPLGTTQVYYTATDRYNNSATCIIDIVVQGHSWFTLFRNNTMSIHDFTVV